jgi:diguanylate cyclase (GGDEF)-like protein
MNDHLKKQTILIVDDTALNIQILIELLNEEFDAVFATSGSEALAMATEILPDLILLDIQMPDMDGYLVCKALKDNPLVREIPVIFITAMSQQEDEIRGLELGAVDYITKPFNPTITKLRVRNQLELKRLRDFQTNLALLDGLTGLPNRRAFDECMDSEWHRAVRNRTKLSMVMIDIDFFKNYNDAHGHLEGDDCLKEVATALAGSAARAGDFVARYGGEEFACILPETDEKGAYSAAERMRLCIELLNIPHGASPTASRVTISLGCATIGPTQDLVPDFLAAMADRMLYKAKRSGRNRVK